MGGSDPGWAQLSYEIDRERPILCSFGTRPEVIKLFPVIEALRRERVDAVLLDTGQHRSLGRDAARTFGLTPDLDLEVMVPHQSPIVVASRILERAGPLLDRVRPQLVIVQGDTTSALAMALAAAHHQVAVAHVEAGLRSNDRRQPFPEELNRELLTTLASYHFAPTSAARSALLDVGVERTSIVVTGNTIVDAQQWALQRLAGSPAPDIAAQVDETRPLVVVTIHRRENHGPGVDHLIVAIRRIAALRGDVQILLPVHPNPTVSAPITEALADMANVVLCDPLDYLALTWVMSRCDLVVTDSGGLQEEAPVLGKPVVILRERTERREGVDAGLATLVGTDPDRVASAVLDMLENPPRRTASPYGDGRAGRRIVDALLGRVVEEFRPPTIENG